MPILCVSAIHYVWKGALINLSSFFLQTGWMTVAVFFISGYIVTDKVAPSFPYQFNIYKWDIAKIGKISKQITSFLKKKKDIHGTHVLVKLNCAFNYINDNYGTCIYKSELKYNDWLKWHNKTELSLLVHNYFFIEWQNEVNVF